MIGNKITIADTMEADIEAVLKQQILQGYEIHKETNNNHIIDDVPNLYDIKSLEALIPVVRTILVANGFKCDSSTALKRFKEIFKPLGQIFSIQKITLPCHTSNVYDFKEYGTEASDISQFFLSSAGFLSDAYAIPELIDYRKKYPQLAKFEDEYNGLISVKTHDSKTSEKGRVLKWKSKGNDLVEQRVKNIADLVAINSYLFNNNKAYTLLNHPKA